MAAPTVGIAIACRTEAELLGRCLDAAVGFDEVVLVDMDESGLVAQVAENRRIRTLSHPPVPFVEQIRGIQLSAAASDWLLFLDPDEILPADWLSVVRPQLARAPHDVAGFRVAYQEVAFGRRLEFVRAVNMKLSLVRRDRAQARDPSTVRPHEQLRLSGSIADLAEAVPRVEHHGYRSVVDAISKLSRYATHGGVGAELPSSDVGPLTPFKMLWGRVVMNRAWRDGSAGVAVASMSAIGDYLGLLRRWESCGYPDARVPRRDLWLLAAARELHVAQWSTRRRIRRISHHGDTRQKLSQ